MSFILANIKRVLTEEAQDVSLTLKDHNPCTFELPSKKLVNLTQPYYVVSNSRLSLWTDVEKYLLKSQKRVYLSQIEYHLPGIIYWIRPESALFLAVRHAVMKISGEESEKGIENIIDKNEGIFEYFKNFYNTVVNVFRFSLQKPSGISEEVEKNILFAMMEWLQYQKVENVTNPVLHSNLISGLFPVTICPDLDLNQTDCFSRHENREINFVNYHFFCFVCQQHFASSKELTSHVQSHEKYVCNCCGVDYETYSDLCCHRLTFCRGANDTKCSFCLLPAKDCTCVKHFENTITQIYEQLNDKRNTAEVSQFVTEGYTYFKEVLMKPSHVKNVELCQTDDPKLTPGINPELWPKVSDYYDEELWEVEGLCIFGKKVSWAELKKQSFSKYLSNYLQFDILKLPLLNYFRDACVVEGCSFIIEKEHYFGTHLRCPISSRMSNDEIPLLYSSDDFVTHLMSHLEQGWFFTGEKLVCNACNFECVEQGKLTLSVITDHAFQHKNMSYTEKCLNSNSQICNEMKFSSVQDACLHLLTFHFKNDKKFRDEVVQNLHFTIFPEKEKWESKLIGTPKSKTNKNPSRNLFATFNTQSQLEVSTNDKDSVSKQPGFINNKPINVNGSDKSNQNTKTNIDPPLNDDKGKHECRNENHKEPLVFKTKEHKDYHVIKTHKCVSLNCQYTNEFESELLKHYQTFHAKTKNICQLCGMGYNDMKEHNDSYHFDCTACKTWFSTLNDLKAHETKCINVVDSGPIKRFVSTSLVNNTLEKESLMIDQTNTENDFSKALLGMLVASDLPQEIKIEYEKSIRKQASESLITKSRLRAECFSDFKSQELFFDLPKWNENVSKDAVKNIQSVLGIIKDEDIFKASSKNSHKFAIANFECLEAAQNRISRTTTICGLSEGQGTILLQNFLHQSVRDEICGYNKTADLLNLSYKRILESLQFLYINIKLSVLESRIMSYRIQEGETIYQFSNRVQRHLSLCSKKLDISLRAAYLENNLAKLLRGNIPSKVLAEINKKESVFSPYTSIEILDIYKSVMSKDEQDYDQYEVMFTQNDYSENSNTKLRGIRKSRNGQKSSKQESSKNRLKELGYNPNTAPILCFLCLEEGHTSNRCQNYPDTSLSSILCKDKDGEPCGYHRHDQCKKQNQVYYVRSCSDEYE